MGKWNHRPRRNHRQKAVASPPRWFPPPPPPDPASGWQDVDPWEKKFCTSVGRIPWWKFVDAKKFTYCHDNILKWNDSAGEEAFLNAKQRFWAKINGLPCDICLPDQDMYVDQVNWNPTIDPDMVSELDQAYFCPDEGGRGSKKTASPHKKNTENGANPWECHDTENNHGLKVEALTWARWLPASNQVDCGSNPWEDSRSQDGGAMVKNAWYNLPGKERDWTQVKSGNGSKDLFAGSLQNGATEASCWGGWRDKAHSSNGGENCTKQSNELKETNNPWENSVQVVVPIGEKGWGDPAYSTSCHRDWKFRENESRNSNGGRNSWKYGSNVHNTGVKDRGWIDHHDNSWHLRRLEDFDNSKSKFQSGTSGFCRGAWNGGSRKREGSLHYVPKYKKPSFHDHEPLISNRRDNTGRRVSFTYEARNAV